jgi:hypothetical protein
MNQGTQGYRLMKNTEGRKSRETVRINPSAQCAKAAATARTVVGPDLEIISFQRQKKTFVKLYMTYVRPHLEFCTPCSLGTLD